MEYLVIILSFLVVSLIVGCANSVNDDDMWFLRDVRDKYGWWVAVLAVMANGAITILFLGGFLFLVSLII